MKPEVVENCGLKTSSFYGSGHEQNGQGGNFGRMKWLEIFLMR